jgi:hypothetical protein
MPCRTVTDWHSYSDRSTFGATDQAQRARMERVADAVGVPFLRYLYYSPRPASLDANTRALLTHLRVQRLAGNIFDFTTGLLLREELRAPDSSLSAAIFTGDRDRPAARLSDLHAGIFDSSIPFSWFIAQQILTPDRSEVCELARAEGYLQPAESDENAEAWAHGIVTGDVGAVERLLEVLEDDADVPLSLPARTLVVSVAVGAAFDADSSERSN